MDDRQLERMLEDLAVRLRTVENVDTPVQRGLVAKLTAVENRVQEMDVQGTHVTQVRLKNIEEDLADIKAMISEDRKDKAADRRVVLGALISAGVAVGGMIVGLVRAI